MNIQKYDLIVVGAGILGTFHAYHALKRGLKVLQLERDNYPVGSTVRNFGQVVPSGMAGVWFDYAVQGLEIYQTIQQEFDISVRNNGSYYIASDPDEVQLIQELSSHYQQHEYAHKMLTKKQICTIFPHLRADYAQEAIAFEQELSVEPQKMIRRLHQYLTYKFSDYTLHYNSTVIGCETISNTVQVSTTNQRIFHSEKVIICNGYEFKLLYRDIFEDSDLQISKLQMMRTQPLTEIKIPGNILTGLTIRRYESFEAYCPSFHTVNVPEHYEQLKKWGIHLLFKQAVDGSIIIGDSHEYTLGTELEELGFSTQEHINQLIWNEANRIVNLGTGHIAHTWTGFYSQHKNNIVEKNIDANIHIRTGIGGKGMTASAGYATHSIASLYDD